MTAAPTPTPPTPPDAPGAAEDGTATQARTGGGPAGAGPAGKSDERVVHRPLLQRLLGRPELGAVVGAIAVFAVFSVVADSFLRPSSLSTVLYASSTLGIMAVPVALLMIGGEFDLSTGVMVTSSSLVSSMFSYQMTANVWVGVGFSLLVTLGIGFFNGYMLVRTKLPSFIITLGTFLMLTGLNLGLTKLISGTVSTKTISDMEGFTSARALFASELAIGPADIQITVVWWLALVVLATWLLLRTRAGNWIFAVGGGEHTARAVGVPVARTKIGLYLGVSLGAWISGQHLLFNYDVVQSGEGVGNELIYIAAAVIGGCLLTGGYGSAVGAAVGAFIFGMTSKGIVYAQWEPDWFKFFLGAMLLVAVLLNAWIRKRAEASR
ncbi:ABC transporter permease [Streptomyces sp. WMMB 322]|uniref:ABC transporter permease n=1 Tax=Streptomyces sp. WMMB 322 TaxID=1286821 RepID=UPI000823E2F0|nr:ABC transporter permease [Streptomyces sp. WMMB 322]SCK42250.1 monosaccharide ABC transporter membrane protein, CUT2 family (TC 3.A.1.2.-) [Streptomyces sp. WMMB 322]